MMIGHLTPDPAIPNPVEATRDGPSQALISRLRNRIEHLERVTLLRAEENESLANQVERLTIENEQLREQRGLRAAIGRAWRRLDA